MWSNTTVDHLEPDLQGFVRMCCKDFLVFTVLSGICYISVSKVSCQCHVMLNNVRSSHMFYWCLSAWSFVWTILAHLMFVFHSLVVSPFLAFSDLWMPLNIFRVFNGRRVLTLAISSTSYPREEKECKVAVSVWAALTSLGSGKSDRVTFRPIALLIEHIYGESVLGKRFETRHKSVIPLPRKGQGLAFI